MTVTAPGATRPPAATPPGAATPPAAAAGPPVATGPAVVARARHGVLRWVEGTPGRLRVLALVTATAALLAGLSLAQAFRASDEALDRARASTAQLVRVQELNTSLVRADAAATTAFLVGGIEPAATRREYEEAVARAAQLVAESARAQPADGRALAALNDELVTYTGLVEQARAANRQALPLGAQYLRTASDGLRASALPVLDAVVEANQDRVELEQDAAAATGRWVGLALLCVLVLVLGAVWMARRTRRLLNRPLLAGTGAVLAATLLSASALGAVEARVRDVRDGPYAATLSLAQARIAAFDARSNESLTLISRGSGARFETAWKASSAEVLAGAQGAAAASSDVDGLADRWQDYRATHERVRAADDGGQWEEAVTLATGTGTTSATGRFADFDRSSGDALRAVERQAESGLAGPGRWLPVAGVLALLVGVAAAVAAWWGVGKRLEEYR